MKQAVLDAAVKYIDSWLDYRYQQLETPGFVIAIRHKDRLVYNRAFGYANLESKTKMATNHIFRIASHSKTFTATAVMQLQEQGKLKIDDPVIRYIPWLKEHEDTRWQSVTIRQLLGHGAGVIRDGLDCDYWAIERPFPGPEEFKKELLRANLVIDNNTKFKYSNYGYTLLGLVVEAAGGMRYHDYVRQHIIKVLGLKDTGPEYETAIKSQTVIGYSRRDLNKQRLPIDAIDTRAMASATGFYSTAEDLCTYAAAHFLDSKALLGIESKKEMQRVQWSGTFGDNREEYGLGFEIVYVDERRVIGHGGGFPGQTTKTLFDPANELVVAVLTNCIDGSPTAINKGIYRIIDWFKKNSTKSEQDLHRFEGRFMNLWSVDDIVAAGETIVIADPDSWTPFKDPTELEYIDSKTLKIKKTSSYFSGGELIRYYFDKKGEVSKIVSAGATMLREEDYLDSLKVKRLIQLRK